MIAATPTLGRRLTVAGAGREAAYAEDDGFVAVLTTTRPLLPNGVQVERLPAVGDELVIRGEPWDPTLRLPAGATARSERARAANPDEILGTPQSELAGAANPDEILGALRSELAGAADREEIVALAQAVETRDASLAAAVGRRLIGRGPGLTPEGDDLVAGAAALLAADHEWVTALIGTDLHTRTTSLSATLLELAARGMGPEPLQAVLAGEPGALARLLALGHSTGRAYAIGAGLALTAGGVLDLGRPATIKQDA